MITDEQIEAWLDAKGITQPAIREATRKALVKLRGEGRLDLQTLGVKTKTTVHKFDHESSGTPQLVETVVAEDGKVTVIPAGSGDPS